MQEVSFLQTVNRGFSRFFTLLYHFKQGNAHFALLSFFFLLRAEKVLFAINLQKRANRLSKTGRILLIRHLNVFI